MPQVSKSWYGMYETALKTGDTPQLKTCIESPQGKPTVTVDLSQLGVSSSTWVVSGNSGTLLVGNVYHYSVYCYDYGFTIGADAAVSDGLKTVSISAVDSSGTTASGTAQVAVDDALPTLSLTDISFSAVPLKGGDSVYLSGLADGTGSPLSAFQIKGTFLDTERNIVLQSFYKRDVLTAAIATSTDGSFNRVAFALGDNEARIISAAPSLRIDIIAYDGSGHTATTSLEVPVPKPPPPDPCIAAGTCVSNVLFLPGIEGSRLYEGTGCGKAAEEKLWEPYESLWGVLRSAGDKKARDLALDSSGASVCTDIYTKEGDVIDTVRGSNIYKSFLDEMNGLKADGTINDWKPVAYDWRFSLDDLLSKGTERAGKIYYEEATSTPYIEQTLRALAAGSKSGKVTIVAHSNGGLVTKALLNRLGGAASSLVDKVVMVGAPQSGAPESLGAALMGYNAGIYKYGFPILSNAAARSLAQNLPMTYHLLPSSEYLESIASDEEHPVARFAGDGYAREIAAYGSTITNTTELGDFLLAREGGRKKPKEYDLGSAEVLNQGLIDYANNTHSILDLWTPPAGIEVSQIAGWGADTVAGIDFYTEPSRIRSFFGPKRRYKPIFIEDGDGTVPVPSALLVASSTSVKRYWVDLNSYRIATSIKRDHKDLFEIPSLEECIKNIIKNVTGTLPPYISTSQPAPIADDKKLVFFLRSSRVLYVRDSPESEEPPVKVTMQVKDPSGKITGIAEDDSVTEDIPDSTYGEFGEVQYLIVPASATPGSRYELTLHGQASSGGVSGAQESTFSLEIQESSGGVATALATLADIPVVASTTASLTIGANIDTVSPLVVDERGDGTETLTVTPVVGETVLYEPPVVETPPAPAQAARAAGGPGYSPYLPLAVSTPASLSLVVLEASTTTLLATATATPAAAVPRIVTPRLVAAPRASNPASTPLSPSAIANAFPDLSQTASVYGASQQPVLKKIGEAVYTSLYRLWAALKGFF
jgi:pimeloyl-ACP methyl ester carboxylesterase